MSSTILGYASNGANMTQMGNLGIKYVGKGDTYEKARYDWYKTQDNLMNLAKKGKLSTGARSGLLSGLQAERQSLISLANALLTTTEGSTSKNKDITTYDIIDGYKNNNKLMTNIF